MRKTHSLLFGILAFQLAAAALPGAARADGLRSDVVRHQKYLDALRKVSSDPAACRKNPDGTGEWDLPAKPKKSFFGRLFAPKTDVNVSSFEREIISRKAWGAREPRSGMSSQKTAGGGLPAYDNIVIHHTEGNGNQSTRSIQDHQMKETGPENCRKQGLDCKDIAYNMLVEELPNGKIVFYQGRDDRKVGSHVKGKNPGSYGIVVKGNFLHKKPSQNLKDGILRAIAYASGKYGTIRKVCTHRHGHTRALNDSNQKDRDLCGINLVDVAEKGSAIVQRRAGLI